ncbi:hypothetical protein [Sphaerotilus sp.]|uniref:hypothetical protein n=1 Tax=Sphaerotilus sp. TaxID=2093942 RepID=UPI002ACD5166|nr:hypothetical protein [Sphaerotilus sp.]MDZ7855860.1 hypothetical protein [Sphaerotilus sp.]
MPAAQPLAATATLDDWHRLGLQIRLALQPDSPGLVRTYLLHAEALIAQGLQPPWRAHERSLTLLLDTAYDALLPIVWRITCLDACCRPLGQLGPLVHDNVTATRLRTLAWRLASFSYRPQEASRP